MSRRNTEIGYCGGLALVAANSEEEARNVFHSHPDYDWMHSEYDGDIYYSYYANWELVSHLHYDTDVPCVIAEDGYNE